MASGDIIVLAEDDALMRRLYDDALCVAGFNVKSACDGHEALDIISKVTPRLVLLDIMMPNLNGIETCKRARKIIGSSVPILFLSALDRFDILQGCLAAGGDDYLIKSDSIASLIARIRAWMRPAKRQGLIARRAKLLEDLRNDPDCGSANMFKDRGAPSQENEADLACLLSLVLEALNAAGPRFGKTPEQKQFLAGYIAGIIESWSAANGAPKDAFLSHLQAIMGATGLISPKDAAETAAAFDDLSKGTIFIKGRTRGRDDAAQRENQGSGHAMRGLADVAASSLSDAAE